jgi:hypothetical protein
MSDCRTTDGISAIEKGLYELGFLLRKFSPRDDEVAAHIILTWKRIQTILCKTGVFESGLGCAGRDDESKNSAEGGLLAEVDASFSYLRSLGLQLPPTLNEQCWRKDLAILYKLTRIEEERAEDDVVPFERLYGHFELLEHASKLLKRQQEGYGRELMFRRIGLALLSAVLGLIVYVLLPSRPWEASYFDNADLRGRPELVHAVFGLDFDTTTYTGSPGVRWKHYSVRYRTRLTLPEDSDVVFTMESDDGSRLIIDGEVVLEQWRPQSRHQLSRTLSLASGPHDIQVDYFQAINEAVLILEIEIVGERGKLHKIPQKYLSYPN